VVAVNINIGKHNKQERQYAALD